MLTSIPLSRRGLLAGSALVGASAAVSTRASASAADVAGAADVDGAADGVGAAFLPPTRAYPSTEIPDAATRHLANRFSYGYTPRLLADIKAAGGPTAWFNAQLEPAQVSDAAAAAFDGWFPTLHRTAQEHYAQARRMNGYSYLASTNHARWTMLRRIYSRRQLHEVMTEFWLNHLHVYGHSDFTWMWRQDYDALIRTHALGRFDAMLQEAIVHPTMLTYLDADLSFVKRRRTRSGQVIVTEKINENLGRELLELHTVGRGAGYTEAAVRDSAYILTGYRIDRFATWAYKYDPEAHYTGPVRVLGFSATNGAKDGRPVLRDYLRYLAHHPSTAQRIARKLAVRFVSDSPSAGLVDHLADVFATSGTDVTATLRALVQHPEFSASAGAKIRTPTEDVAATMRALGVRINRPAVQRDAANAIYYVSKNAGQVPFGWAPPNGFPDNGEIWASAARLMGSFRLHYSTAGGYYPSTGATYRPHASWLPEPRIRFDALVDHLCRLLHGRGSTSLLLGAAVIAVEVQPDEVITSSHRLVKWKMPKLLGILLDTQQHMTR